MSINFPRNKWANEPHLRKYTVMQVPHPAGKEMRPREGKDRSMVPQPKLLPNLLSPGQLYQAMKNGRYS